MAPMSARVRQASPTVVGDTPRRFDNWRTVGSLVPTVSSPDDTSRPMAVAMPRALRSSMARWMTSIMGGVRPSRVRVVSDV